MSEGEFSMKCICGDTYKATLYTKMENGDRSVSWECWGCHRKFTPDPPITRTEWINYAEQEVPSE